MTLDSREKVKLLNRVKRIRGQIDSVERALASEDHDCPDVLMLLAAARAVESMG
jgi:FrmR/RcnR family transcriptional regulator, repressor of rcnA expression